MVTCKAPGVFGTARANSMSAGRWWERYSASVSTPPASTIRASEARRASAAALSPRARAAWNARTVAATSAESPRIDSEARRLAMLEAEATEADAIANIRLATRVPHARTVPLGRRCISSFHIFERDDER